MDTGDLAEDGHAVASKKGSKGQLKTSCPDVAM